MESQEQWIKKRLIELSKLPDNNTCVDCNTPNPQWASISHGTFICLECSGHHRSLGVHISFVRSITMDKWTLEQFEKMEKGGNKRARAYFENVHASKHHTSIKDKYNTDAAKHYREYFLKDLLLNPVSSKVATTKQMSSARGPRRKSSEEWDVWE